MKSFDLSVDDIHPYAKNNRIHSTQQVERIADSIKRFGFNQPVVIDENNEILVGHGRLLAAQKLNLETCPVVKLENLSATEKRAYRILDNKLQNDSEWDFDALQSEVEFLAANDFDLEFGGLSELVSLFPIAEPEVTDDEFNGELLDETFIKLGDLIELGRHRVLCGDSTKAEDVAELMKQKAEMLFTSPPYSDMREYEKNADLSEEVVSEFISVFAPHANYCVFNLGIKRKDHNIIEYWNIYLNKAKKAYIKFLAWNVWDKQSAGSIGQQSSFIPISHEWVFVFGNEFKDINRTIERRTPIRKDRARSVRQQDGTMKYSTIGEQKVMKEMESVSRCMAENSELRKRHPAIMGIEIAFDYISAMTNQSDLVADPFLGSGTTLMACEQLNRTCYGMEISPKYCQVIIERYQKHCEKNNKAFECKINGVPFKPIV